MIDGAVGGEQLERRHPDTIQPRCVPAVTPVRGDEPLRITQPRTSTVEQLCRGGGDGGGRGGGGGIARGEPPQRRYRGRQRSARRRAGGGVLIAQQLGRLDA